MRVSPWGRVVAISALLVVGGSIALAVGALATTKELVATYPVTGSLEAVAVDLADSDIVIVGGGARDTVEVKRSEPYAFGHRADPTRRVDGATFRVRSRCPATLLGPC